MAKGWFACFHVGPWLCYAYRQVHAFAYTAHLAQPVLAGPPGRRPAAALTIRARPLQPRSQTTYF